MGRGGTGNIEVATAQQCIAFDVTKDPDDSYEQIILEKAATERRNKPVCYF